MLIHRMYILFSLYCMNSEMNVYVILANDLSILKHDQGE